MPGHEPQPGARPLDRRTGEDAATWTLRLLDYTPGSRDPERPRITEITRAWLDGHRAKSANTGDAYARDLGRWLAWCLAQGLDPLDVQASDSDRYVRAMHTAEEPSSPATINRRLSAVSSWYQTLVERGAVGRNPVILTGRPRVSKDSPTIVLSPDEASRFLRAAAADAQESVRLRTRALLSLMLDTGMRVGQPIDADVSDLGWDGDQRTITVRAASGDVVKVLPRHTAAAVGDYLADRAAAAGVPVEQLTGPLFVTASGGRIDRWYVNDLIRRIARAAGIPAWERLTAGSLRRSSTVLRARIPWPAE